MKFLIWFSFNHCISFCLISEKSKGLCDKCLLKNSSKLCPHFKTRLMPCWISMLPQTVKLITCFHDSWFTKFSFKVLIFWEGHKILWNLYSTSKVHTDKSKVKISQILWPSQNISTLQMSCFDNFKFGGMYFIFWNYAHICKLHALCQSQFTKHSNFLKDHSFFGQN